MVCYDTFYSEIRGGDLIGMILNSFYYIAEVVGAEKEHSEWLPERSKFSYTDGKDGPLAL